jgi:hypothetical protein
MTIATTNTTVVRLGSLRLNLGNSDKLYIPLCSSRVCVFPVVLTVLFSRERHTIVVTFGSLVFLGEMRPSADVICNRGFNDSRVSFGDHQSLVVSAFAALSVLLK